MYLHCRIMPSILTAQKAALCLYFINETKIDQCMLFLSVLFEMQSFGPSLVKLMSIATGRYLTMRRDGTLRGLVSDVFVVFQGIFNLSLRFLLYLISLIKWLRQAFIPRAYIPQRNQSTVNTSHAPALHCLFNRLLQEQSQSEDLVDLWFPCFLLIASSCLSRASEDWLSKNNWFLRTVFSRVFEAKLTRWLIGLSLPPVTVAWIKKKIKKK